MQKQRTGIEFTSAFATRRSNNANVGMCIILACACMPYTYFVNTFVHMGFSSISAAVAVTSLQTPTYVAVVAGPVRIMSSAGAGMLR